MTIGEAIQSAQTVEEIRRVGYAVMGAVHSSPFSLSDLAELPMMIPVHSDELLRSTYKARLVMWRYGLPKPLQTHLNQLPIQ